jgi:hypothetical protein
VVEPITQFCIGCKTRKPIRGFDIELSLCADCKDAHATTSGRTSSEALLESDRPSRDMAACPYCVQQVPLDPATLTLGTHLVRRGVACHGSGQVLASASQDALDHRLNGSFESS